MPKIEQTLTSMEVAEMIGREHNALLKTIRGFVSYMERIADSNNAPGDEVAEGENAHGSKDEYFKDSIYEDANGQKRPCFNVTKKGCEFIAHKMSGVKGTEFTMRYIDRFHKMEETFATPKLPQTTLELLELHYQALKEVDGKVNAVSSEVQTVRGELQNLKDGLPVFITDAKDIQNAIRKKAIEVLGGTDSNAYHDHSIHGYAFSDIQIEVRRQFGVKRYDQIKHKDVPAALKVVEDYKPPLHIKEKIEAANAQISLNLEGGAC